MACRETSCCERPESDALLATDPEDTAREALPDEERPGFHYGDAQASGALRRTRQSVKVGFIASLALASAVALYLLRPERSADDPWHQAQLRSTIDASAAAETEKDMDYVYDTLVGPGHYDNVLDVRACFKLCLQYGECKGYTWVADAKLLTDPPSQCWLKGGGFKSKAPKLGVVSGFVVLPESSSTTTIGGSSKPPPVPTPPPATTTTAAATSEAPATTTAAAGRKESVAENKRGAEPTTSERAASTLKVHAGEKEASSTTQASTTLKVTTTAAPTTTTEEDIDRSNCAALGEGCLDSKCCKEPGAQCFTKNDFWAQCMEECQPGPNPMDQVSPSPWACQPVGNRTPGKPRKVVCSAPGENCVHTQCCAQGGTQCWTKNTTWAECRPSCTPGPQLTAKDSAHWTCAALGKRRTGAAPWVAQQCASGGTDCKDIACCAWGGHQCYKQTDFYAQCKPTCTPGEQPVATAPAWSCLPVGQRTPDLPEAVMEQKTQVGWWVQDKCSLLFDDCSKSQCCQAVNHQCYRKDKTYAACRDSCSTDPDPNDGNKSWTCEPLGPRGWGLAVKGYPSLFCLSLFMPYGYEGDLLRAHLNNSAGIFGCDGFDVFASDPCFLGNTSDGRTVNAVIIPKIEVGVSQDGTAGNAKLFMAFWDTVIAGGRFRNYDWTIKVDPDAVLVAWRVRAHMAQHTGERVYVVNCNKFPGSPNFPMMYGAVEIFSGPAMLTYAENSWKCGQQLPWNAWGEDYYMTHCMDYIGVGRIGDFGVLGDNMCTGANCGDGWTAAFHPFKSIDSWMGCWWMANR